MPPLLNTIIRLVILVFSFALFGAGINLAYRGEVGGASVNFTAGVMTLIFVFLSQFKRFKGFGIEAEMWAKEMEDAERITTNFKNLSMLVAQPSISTMARMGRWDSGLSRREMYDLVQRFDQMLREAEASDEQILAAKEDYFRYVLLDMAQMLRGPLTTALEEKVEHYKEETKKFGSPITDLEGHRAAADKFRWASAEKENVLDGLLIENITDGVDTLLSRIKSCQLFTTEESAGLIKSMSAEIDDLRYFKDNREFRRPEVWFSDDEND